MYDTVKNMKCFNKSGELQNSLQIFQKGILMSITSLKLLRTKMNEKFGFKFILTHRLNQDCLENFFCQIRGRSGQSDHPTPVECLQRIKIIMLGKNPGVALHNHANTIERDPEEYVSAKFMNALTESKCIKGNGTIHSDGVSDLSSKFIQDTSVGIDTLPNELSSADCSDWAVESQVDGLIRPDIPQNEFLDNSDEWPVEFLEFTALEIERLESLSSEYCEEISDEFLADLDNDMPVNEVSKRIDKTIEDGIGRILVKRRREVRLNFH